MTARRTWLLAAALLSLSFGRPADSKAQQRYQPSRPTVSPYLNLFRENNGVIPNYQSLVRPQLQQDELNQYQSRALQQQSQRIQQLQVNQQELVRGVDVLHGMTVAPTGKSAGFAKPGTRSNFRNTSTYYPARGGAARAY